MYAVSWTQKVMLILSVPNSREAKTTVTEDRTGTAVTRVVANGSIKPASKEFLVDGAVLCGQCP